VANNTHIERLSFFIKPGAQISLMLFTLVLLFSSTYIYMRHPTNNDPMPGVKTFESRPDYSATNIVKTGFFVRNFLEFDVNKNNFVADSYIWFEFDPKSVPLEAVADFYFGKADIKQKSPAYTATIDKKMIVGYNLQVGFQTNLIYRKFPLDNHCISLTLNNAALPKYHAILLADGETFQVADSIYASGWSYQDKHVTSGLQINTLEPKTQHALVTPRVVFGMDFANESFKRLLLILLPLFIISFLSLFTLSLDPFKDAGTIVTISATMMAALVSYNFVIEAASPKVSYFTFGDTLFNTFLVLNFIIFIIDTVWIKKLAPYRGIVVILFHLTLIAWWFMMLYR